MNNLNANLLAFRPNAVLWAETFKLKQLIKSLLPVKILEQRNEARHFALWKKRGYLDHSPQSVKEKLFLRHGVPGAQWIETGTFLGTTTNFLEINFGKVYSIEPANKLYQKAMKRFKDRNVEMLNGVSEHIMPKLLPQIRGDVNFWLDGHFSEGETFQGAKDCPVEDELEAIEKNIRNFDKVAILIDDVRFFVPDEKKYRDYPSLDYLVDWSRRNGFIWNIEHDIFIMRNYEKAS